MVCIENAPCEDLRLLRVNGQRRCDRASVSTSESSESVQSSISPSPLFVLPLNKLWKKPLPVEDSRFHAGVAIPETGRRVF